MQFTLDTVGFWCIISFENVMILFEGIHNMVPWRKGYLFHIETKHLFLTLQYTKFCQRLWLHIDNGG